jgi:RNA polymerase sigma factor (sigma-70 family)
VSAETQKRRIAEFFRQERDRLVGYVRRWVRDTADRDVEDIVHDVMVNLFNATDVAEPIENLSAYIYRSLNNRVVDGFRRRRNSLSLEARLKEEGGATLGDLISDIRYEAPVLLEKRELRDRLHRAIDGLNPKQRDVFLATELEGMSFRELSGRWGVPLGTLLSQKHRAVQKIRSALENYIEEEK